MERTGRRMAVYFGAAGRAGGGSCFFHSRHPHLCMTDRRAATTGRGRRLRDRAEAAAAWQVVQCRVPGSEDTWNTAAVPPASWRPTAGSCEAPEVVARDSARTQADTPCVPLRICCPQRLEPARRSQLSRAPSRGERPEARTFGNTRSEMGAPRSGVGEDCCNKRGYRPGSRPWESRAGTWHRA